MSDRLYVATRKGLFEWRRSAAGQWSLAEQSFLGYPVHAVLAFADSDHVYAALGHEHFGMKLHYSVDGGATWSERAVPEYPKPLESAEPDRCPVRGIEIPWRLNMIWVH